MSVREEVDKRLATLFDTRETVLNGVMDDDEIVGSMDAMLVEALSLIHDLRKSLRETESQMEDVDAEICQARGLIGRVIDREDSDDPDHDLLDNLKNWLGYKK